jgi:hypothetical protein
MTKEFTDHCQRVDRCPTSGIPAKGVCRGLQSCTAAVTAARSFTKDNRSKHPLDPIRKGMLHRCDKRSSYYQAGISVHPEWVRDPWAFFRYMEAELPPRPLDEYVTIGGRRIRRYTLDRINNDGNYEPGNVRWLDRAEQNRNRGHGEHARENGWRKWSSCQCPWAARQNCPCDDAVAFRAGEVIKNEEIEPWPPGSQPEKSAERQRPTRPPTVLGQIVELVPQGKDGQQASHFPFEIRWFEIDERGPVSDPEPEGLWALLPDDSVDFSDLLGEEDTSNLSDLLDESEGG